MFFVVCVVRACARVCVYVCVCGGGGGGNDHPRLAKSLGVSVGPRERIQSPQQHVGTVRAARANPSEHSRPDAAGPLHLDVRPRPDEERVDTTGRAE